MKKGTKYKKEKRIRKDRTSPYSWNPYNPSRIIE